MTISKGAQVTITNVAGNDCEHTEDPKYRIIGQTGYVSEAPKDGWVHVLIPTHLYYSKGRGAALKLDEVALV